MNIKEQTLRLGFLLVLIAASPYARELVDGVGDVGYRRDIPYRFAARDFMIEKSKTCSLDIFLSDPMAFSSKSSTLS